MYRLRRGIAAAVGALIGLGGLTTPAAAQTPPAAAETLFILARVEGKRSPKELKDDFEAALKAAKAVASPVELPKAMPAGLYYQLDSVIRNADPKNAVVAKSERGMEMRQLPVADSRWEFRLPDPKTQILKELTVNYRKAGAVRYVSKADGKGDREFELIDRGRYAVPLAADDYPIDYKAVLLDRNADKPIVDAGVWPAEQQFFMITIRDFQGDKKALFEKLRDPLVIGNPIKELQQQEGFTFVFASLGSDTIDKVDSLLGNVYTMTVGKVPGVVPRRVWIQFPLTKDAAAAKVKELNALPRDEVSKAIRAAAPNLGNGEAQVDASKPAQWIELPDQGIGQPFSRKLNLGELAPFAKSFPEVYQVVVWEFDNDSGAPGTPYALRIGNDFATPQELKTLSTAVSKAKGEPKK